MMTLIRIMIMPIEIGTMIGTTMIMRTGREKIYKGLCLDFPVVIAEEDGCVATA